jgi:hypothetical protein
MRKPSCGNPQSKELRISTVGVHHAIVVQYGHQISQGRFNEMMKAMHVRKVFLAGIMALFGCFGCSPDYHSNEEIAREALKSGLHNMKQTEMRIVEENPLHVGSVVLNQFLGEFRRRETHYAIRLASYDVLLFDFIERLDNQLSYTARIRVVPQDKTRFTKIIDGLFPYEESGDAILFSIRFIISQEGDTYKLVDVQSG